MTTDIPEKIVYYGVEFTKDMVIDKNELSVRNSIFTQYDTDDHNGQFNEHEWETFVRAVQSEEAAKSKMKSNRNAITAKRYQKKADNARHRLNKLMKNQPKLSSLQKLEEFNELHNTNNLLKVLGDNETPPEGVEVIDISDMAIGWQEEFKHCYQRGYISGLENLTPELQAEYKELLNQSLQELKEYSEFQKRTDEIRQEINKYNLMADMADEGIVSETQSAYQDDATYQDFSTRIRSNENPFWSQMNQLEVEINKLIKENAKLPDTPENKTVIKQIQQQIGQNMKQLNQLNIASNEWFKSMYGGSSDLTGGESQMLKKEEKIDTEFTDSKELKDGSESVISDKESPKTPMPEKQTAGKLQKDENTDKTSNSNNDNKTDTDKETDENDEQINPDFYKRMSPESIRTEALGTPNKPSNGDGKDSGAYQSLQSSSGDTDECSDKRSDSPTDDMTVATASFSENSNIDGLNMSISGNFSIAMNEMIVPDMSQTTDTSPDTDSIATTIIESEQDCISDKDDKIIEEFDESDKTIKSDDGLTDDDEDIQVDDTLAEAGIKPVPSLKLMGLNPQQYESTLMGGLSFTQRYNGATLKASADAQLNTNISPENMTLDGRLNTSLKLNTGKSMASLTTSLIGQTDKRFQVSDEILSFNNGDIVTEDSDENGNSSLKSKTKLDYNYNGKNLHASVSGTVTITQPDNNTENNNESPDIRTQGNYSLTYFQDRFSLMSFGTFAASDDSHTLNSTLAAKYGRFSFNASAFNYEQTISGFGGMSSSMSNSNYSGSLAYTDGNFNLSLSHSYSETSTEFASKKIVDSSHITDITGQYKLDRAYVQAKGTFTNISSEFSIGTGGNFVMQQNRNFSLTAQPGIDVGYNTADQSIITSAIFSGGLQYNDGTTTASLSATDTFNALIYTDGTGSYVSNMLTLRGDLSSGHFGVHGIMTHRYEYNSSTTSGNTLGNMDFDLSALTGTGSQSNTPTTNQSLIFGIGGSYTNDRVTIDVTGMHSPQSGYSITAGATIRFGGKPKSRIPKE